MMDNTTTLSDQQKHPFISIGIIAWNEEKGIRATLESLFQQSLFARLKEQGLHCEIVCAANGCTDNTAGVASEVFNQQAAAHPFRETFTCISHNLRERGKINTWNSYVHRLSARSAEYLFLMDADILFLHPDTLWNMVVALQEDASASISTDRPEKSISFKKNKSLLEKFSLRASQLTQAGDAQLCGQLYCIRSKIARRIYLPRDLGACEDGFIKWIVCTDFFTTRLNTGRIILAKDAAHSFDAYTSPSAILRNQKRQMIGQVVVHLLVDEYLKTLAVPERIELAATLKEKEQSDPLWLKRLIGDYIRRTRHFWQLIPGLVSFRFKRLARLHGVKKIACFPIAMAGLGVALFSCHQAYAFLKQGTTDYWPHGKSPAAGNSRKHESGLTQPQLKHQLSGMK